MSLRGLGTARFAIWGLPIMWRDNVFFFSQIKQHSRMSAQKISTQMCFSSTPNVRVCVCVCMHSTNEAVCGAIGFSLNTQRPRELPRAERTASVCVLVPSKQANLENTKGAANKHNLIPLSSYTWL